MSSTGFVWEQEVFETHITLRHSGLHSEKAADNTVSADDFQFPSAKYEIIVLPILSAKLERQRNTTAKSSVCSTRNETVTFLYSLITEINLEVDSEMSMVRGEHSVGRTGIKVNRLSYHFLCMSLASQCKVEQPVFCYLNSVVQRGKQKLPFLFKYYEWFCGMSESLYCISKL